MTAVVDDYAAIAAKLRGLGGNRSGIAVAMPTRALDGHAAERGIIPPDPAAGAPSSRTGPKRPAQPGASSGGPDPDWPYCFWFGAFPPAY